MNTIHKQTMVLMLDTRSSVDSSQNQWRGETEDTGKKKKAVPI